MTILEKTTIVMMTGLLVLVLLTGLVTRGKADNIAAILEDEDLAPFIDSASAVIYAPSMTQGALFQLRGAVGSGWFTRKNENNYWCDVADIRLLTGDFGGDTVGVSQTEPVVLIALNSIIAKRLSRGQDIMSEDYILRDIEQVLASGVDEVDFLVVGSGGIKGNYILNPGRNILSDVFGASSTNNACMHNSAYAAIISE